MSTIIIAIQNPSALSASALSLRQSLELKLDTSPTLQDIKKMMMSAPWTIDPDDDTEVLESIIIGQSNLGDCLAACYKMQESQHIEKQLQLDLLIEIKKYYPELTLTCDFLATLPIESMCPEEGIANVPWIWNDEDRETYKHIKKYKINIKDIDKM